MPLVTHTTHFRQDMAHHLNSTFSMKSSWLSSSIASWLPLCHCRHHQQQWWVKIMSKLAGSHQKQACGGIQCRHPLVIRWFVSFCLSSGSDDIGTCRILLTGALLQPLPMKPMVTSMQRMPQLRTNMINWNPAYCSLKCQHGYGHDPKTGTMMHVLTMLFVWTCKVPTPALAKIGMRVMTPRCELTVWWHVALERCIWPAKTLPLVELY